MNVIFVDYVVFFICYMIQEKIQETKGVKDPRSSKTPITVTQVNILFTILSINTFRSIFYALRVFLTFNSKINIRI